jgi:cytoskeleton protein RodZ
VETSNNHEGKEIEEEVSLGTLLKRSREEHQLELDEAFRVTRIRRHTLEALENDRWDELPSQVFVKGFLKTYAEFLGLGKERVLELYEEVLSARRAQSEPMKQVSPRTRRWLWSLVIALLVLAFIASIAFLSRKDISIVGKAFQFLTVQGPVEERLEEPVGKESWNRSHADKPEDLASQESVEGRDLAEEMEFTGAVSLAEEPSEEALSPESDLTGLVTLAEQAPEEPPAPPFDLTAQVRRRTWIAIHVDDQPVKEYLFQPGETFAWKAHKGFDILVGNAGGIDFELNGMKIGKLGAEGKVVRARLPKTDD